jgi:hypothetical protein
MNCNQKLKDKFPDISNNLMTSSSNVSTNGKNRKSDVNSMINESKDLI